MTRNTKLLLLSLIAVVIVANACVQPGTVINLPLADCSWIDQPDSGGLICLGLNSALYTGVGALLVLLVYGLGALLGAAVPGV